MNFSNCNAEVVYHFPDWDGETMTDEELQNFPPHQIKWKNRNTGEEKNYEISLGLAVCSDCFGSELSYITLSPSGRYIAMWYTRLDHHTTHDDGNLYIMIIDTETQVLTKGSGKDFGEFIDKSSTEHYHGCCGVRILDNGILHIVTVSECYENYLMDPKTNKVILNIKNAIEELGGVILYGAYLCSIATPESLLLMAEDKIDELNDVFEYEVETGKTSLKKMSKQSLEELSQKYSLSP